MLMFQKVITSTILVGRHLQRQLTLRKHDLHEKAKEGMVELDV